jgi:hypothetical protein
MKEMMSEVPGPFGGSIFMLANMIMSILPSSVHPKNLESSVAIGVAKPPSKPTGARHSLMSRDAGGRQPENLASP